MIRAWGIGCSVSASVTRPTMIRAGSSAAVTDFARASASVSTGTCARANRGSLMPSSTRRPRPAPRMVNRPSASLNAGRGQAGRSLWWNGEKEGPSRFSTLAGVPFTKIPGTTRPMAWTVTSISRTGRPFTSNSRPSITCSGLSAMSAAGRSASGSSSTQPAP